jgi:nucleotide-binding universal stress UspA family protein
MLDKAIVPLDGSATAEVALPYAEEFAGRTGAELILLFVKEPHDYRSENVLQCYLDNLVIKAKEDAKPYFNESGIKELKVRSQILTGNPAEEILNFSESNQNSKIIMATHGQSGVGTRWALGSVADKVSRAVQVPMVLIRAGRDKPAVHPKGILKYILAPLDGSKGAEAALPYVMEMGRKLKAEVTFVKVIYMDIEYYGSLGNTVIDQKEAEAKQYLGGLVENLTKQGIQAKFEVLKSATDTASEIIRYTENNYTDIVIMATHGRSGPRRWMMGSVTNQVLREGNTPIMLVRPSGVVKD